MNDTPLNPIGTLIFEAATVFKKINDDVAASKKANEIKVTLDFTAKEERIRKQKEAEAAYWLRENAISSKARIKSYRSNLMKYRIEHPEAVEQDFIEDELNRISVQRSKVDKNDPIQRNVGHILDRVKEYLTYKLGRLETSKLEKQNKGVEESIKLRFQGDREQVTAMLLWMTDAGIIDMADSELARFMEQSVS